MNTIKQFLNGLREKDNVSAYKDQYQFSKDILIDLEYAIKTILDISTYSKSYSSVLFCSEDDLKLSIPHFLEKNYKHLADVDTKRILGFWSSTTTTTFLQCALILECCMINLYNSEYFKVEPSVVAQKLINIIYCAAKEDLDQLLRDGEYSAMLKYMVLNKIKNEIGYKVIYTQSTNILSFETGDFTDDSEPIEYGINFIPCDKLCELDKLLDKICKLLKYN